ncbi:MAG: hypothetical protein ACOX9E_05380 [Lentisphaeria bacterium]
MDQADQANTLHFNYFFMALCASAKQPLAFAAFRRREAAEALKAQDIPAQGKHTESVRRPG